MVSVAMGACADKRRTGRRGTLGTAEAEGEVEPRREGDGMGGGGGIQGPPRST